MTWEPHLEGPWSGAAPAAAGYGILHQPFSITTTPAGQDTASVPSMTSIFGSDRGQTLLGRNCKLIQQKSKSRDSISDSQLRRRLPAAVAPKALALPAPLRCKYVLPPSALLTPAWQHAVDEIDLVGGARLGA